VISRRNSGILFVIVNRFGEADPDVKQSQATA
jgi:hypothetical protein